MLKVALPAGKTGEPIPTACSQGFRFIRKQGAMQALIVLAFAMTFLAVPIAPSCRFSPSDIFHRNPETYALFLSVSGLGSIVGSLSVAGMGNVRKKGRVALFMLVCLGAAIAGFSLSTIFVFTCIMLFLSGGAMMAVFAMVSLSGATDRHQRDARPRDERLQFRFPRRHGDGKPGYRLARPDLHRTRGAGRAGLLLVGLALYFLLFERRRRRAALGGLPAHAPSGSREAYLTVEVDGRTDPGRFCYSPLALIAAELARDQQDRAALSRTNCRGRRG